MWSICTLLIFCTASLCSLKDPLQYPPGGTYKLDKSYHIDFEHDTGGGCKQYQQQLEQSYFDALEMIDKAREALDELRREQPADDPTYPAARDEWLRKAEAYIAMFNQHPRKTTVSDDDEPLESRAYGVMDRYRNWIDQHVVFDGQTSNKWFFCSDTFLNWKPPSYPDPDWEPADGGTQPKLEDTPECKKGDYVADALPKGDKKWCFIKPKLIHPVCSNNDDLGVTLWKDNSPNRIMLFCPLKFRVKQWDVRQERANVQPDTCIEDYFSSHSQTWVHEWGHLFQPWEDQPAVTKTDKPDRSLTGRQAKSYGWAKSHFLAVYKYKDTLEERDATIPNPDNFAMFALAVYLDNFWWGTGYARSQPVSLQPQRRNDGNATGFVVSRLKS